MERSSVGDDVRTGRERADHCGYTLLFGADGASWGHLRRPPSQKTRTVRHGQLAEWCLLPLMQIREVFIDYGLISSIKKRHGFDGDDGGAKASLLFLFFCLF